METLVKEKREPFAHFYSFFITLSLAISLFYFKNYSGNISSIINNNFVIIIQFIGIYFLVHCLRIFRLYILLLDSKVRLLSLFKEYMIIAWVNLLVPFKLGELFKIYRFVHVTKKFNRGLSVIWIERIFDSTILLSMYLFSLAYDYSEKFLSLVLLLFLFVFFSFIFYLEFPLSYKYINDLIMGKSKSHKGLYFLRQLKKAQSFHREIKLLLRGRLSLLLFVSLAIWFLELLGIALLVKTVATQTSIVKEFLLLLNNSFMFNVDQSSMIQRIYMIVGISLVMIFVPLSYWIGMGSQEKKYVGVNKRA